MSHIKVHSIPSGILVTGMHHHHPHPPLWISETPSLPWKHLSGLSDPGVMCQLSGKGGFEWLGLQQRIAYLSSWTLWSTTDRSIGLNWQLLSTDDKKWVLGDQLKVDLLHCITPKRQNKAKSSVSSWGKHCLKYVEPSWGENSQEYVSTSKFCKAQPSWGENSQAGVRGTERRWLRVTSYGYMRPAHSTPYECCTLLLHKLLCEHWIYMYELQRARASAECTQLMSPTVQVGSYELHTVTQSDNGTAHITL